MRQDRVRGTGRTEPHASVSLGNALPFAVHGGMHAAADARAELAARLAPRLDPEVVEVARLLLSELVTNCVLHGAASSPEVSIDYLVDQLSTRGGISERTQAHVWFEVQRAA